MGLYKVIRTTEHTMVFDVDEVQNVASVNRVSLVRTTNDDGLQCGVTENVNNDDNKQEATPDVGDELA